jgi:transcriptional regulator with XRE-family HTH domain
MTQRKLAAQTNCALATIKKIEQDERCPSRELAEGMASALRISADKIAVFVECARGLRTVDVLASIRGEGEAEKNESWTPCSDPKKLDTKSIELILTPVGADLPASRPQNRQG